MNEPEPEPAPGCLGRGLWLALTRQQGAVGEAATGADLAPGAGEV